MKHKIFVVIFILIFCFTGCGEDVSNIQTQEEARAVIEETYQAYLDMQKKLWVQGLDTGDGKYVTLAGYGSGYFEVKEPGFNSISDIKEYIKTICTPTFAEENYYYLNEGYPLYVEQNGKLYILDVAMPWDVPPIKKIEINQWNKTQIIATINFSGILPGDLDQSYEIKVKYSNGKWRVDGLENKHEL